MSADTSVTPPSVSDARLLGRGLAGVRIFLGLIELLDGLAKLFGWHTIRIGPYLANLINRDDARFILDFEVNKNPAGGQPGTKLPLLPDIADFMLNNWGLFGWGLTAVEIGTGLLLVLGLGTRAAALVALGEQLFLALVYVSSDRWLFEQPHEYVPLVILALVPAGRVWGLDAWAAMRTGRTGPGLKASWPF
ncbi:MAG: DoxX family membrane protein [Mycobacteriales bacterium]